MKKCIIFGAGAFGRYAFELLKKDYQIVSFSDNNSNKWGKSICNRTIIPPHKIELDDKTSVIIASRKFYQEIATKLENQGISAKVLLSYYNINKKIRTYRLAEYKDDICKITDNTFSDITSDTKINHNSKKVLLIAYYYPPMGGGGVQRPVKFVKYLKKYGYDVTVVTSGIDEGIGILDESINNEIEGTSVIRIQDYPVLFNELDEKKRNQILGLYNGIVKSNDWMNSFFGMHPFRLIPEDRFIWVYDVLNELEKRVDLSEFSCVITTIPPNDSSAIGFYLKKRFNMKWIMDYRDAWCLDPYGVNEFDRNILDTLELQKEMEIQLLNYADYVVAAGERVCQEILEIIPNKKTKCITNGYDEDDFKGINEETKPYFELLYNGTIGNDNNPIPLINIVNELIDRGELEKDVVRISFVGRIREPINQSIFAEYDKYNIVSAIGYIPHIDSLRKAYNADVLILFGAYSDGAYYVYTGKIFELLRIGKPILSFSSPYGLHYEMIEKRGRGITATYEDKEKIRDFILMHYDYWKENGHTVRYEIDDYVSNFSRERLTGELAKVLDEVIE